MTLTVTGRGFEGFPGEPSSSAEASD